MSRPIIAVLQEDPQTLVELLARRFDREYEIAVFTAPEDFAAALQRWKAWRPMGGAERRFVSRRDGVARRMWRVTFPATAVPIVVRVVAPYLAPRTSELRDLLDRNRVTAEFIDPNSATAENVRSSATQAAGVDDVVIAPPYGGVLTNPTNREIAEALVPTSARRVRRATLRSSAPAQQRWRPPWVGAGNSAGQAAVYLARYAERVTLVVRGDSLSASLSDYLVRELSRTPNVTVLLRTEVVAAEGDPHLEWLTLRSRKRPRAGSRPTGCSS